MIMAKTADIVLLWERHTSLPSRDTENDLIEFYKKDIKKIAQFISNSSYRRVPVEELMSPGMCGAWDALRKFDPSRGKKFWTFAEQKIRGFILEYIRESDKLSRLGRKRVRLLKGVQEDFDSRGLVATKEDIKASIGLSDNQYFFAVYAYKADSMLSLDAPSGSTTSRGDLVPLGRVCEEVDSHYDAASKPNNLVEFTLCGLNSSERDVFLLYYYGKMKLKAIGEKLNLSESRISQMMKAIFEKTATRLREQGSGLYLEEIAS